VRVVESEPIASCPRRVGICAHCSGRARCALLFEDLKESGECQHTR
jgi:hypothetical protein